MFSFVLISFFLSSVLILEELGANKNVQNWYKKSGNVV